MKSKNIEGFTLVEIAIVLVIVGLLIGGVLKGQEMVTNAKLKRIESDNAGLATAIFSYQDRYRQLPGDDSNAYSRFDQYSTLNDVDVNGNGQGTIDGSWNELNTSTLSSAGAIETEKIFAHLRASGLIAGGSDITTKPTNAYGGQIGFQDGALGISGHVTIFGQLEGPIVKIIESRMDDDLSDEGNIQSQVSNIVDGMAPGAAPALSQGNGGTHYNDSLRYNMAIRL